MGANTEAVRRTREEPRTGGAAPAAHAEGPGGHDAPGRDPGPPAGEQWIAECVDPRHPTLSGRILVRWEGEAAARRWVPTLQDVPVRKGDRVLLSRPENWNEPVAVGVLDGYARRPEIDRREAAALELERDECLRVRSSNGEELLEIHRDREGPVVRLLRADVDLELPGALRLAAEDISLEARQGRVTVRATDDVVVKGEVVRLN